MTREGKPKRHHARPFTTRKQTQHKKHNRIHDTTCNHRKLRSNVLSDKSMKTGTAKTTSDSASYQGNIENRVRSGFARDFTPETTPLTASQKRETFKILSEAVLRETSTPKRAASYILQIQSIDSFKETYTSCQRHCLFGMCPHCKGGAGESVVSVRTRIQTLPLCTRLCTHASMTLVSSNIFWCRPWSSGVVYGLVLSGVVWAHVLYSHVLSCPLMCSGVVRGRLVSLSAVVR